CGRALTDAVSRARGIGPECLGHITRHFERKGALEMNKCETRLPKTRRVIISQYGVEELEHYRSFILKLPADLDAEDIPVRVLEDLADEAGVEWDCEDSTGIEARAHDEEQSLEPSDEVFVNLPVVKYDQQCRGQGGGRGPYCASSSPA